MNKSSVIILIVAAVVFTGLGFLVGNVMAKGQVPGSADDPVLTQAGVEKLVASRLITMQDTIDRLEAQIASLTGEEITPPNGTGDDPSGTGDDDNANEPVTTKTVTVTSDSVNIRATASTSASIVASDISRGTVLTYISETTASDYVWYKVKTSGGLEGWIRSDLCSEPK